MKDNIELFKTFTTSDAGLPVMGFGAVPELFKLPVEFIDELSFLPLRDIVKCNGS